MSPQRRPMALVHEWLNARAGSEILFEQMALAFPDADLFALAANQAEEQFDFGGRTLRTTVIDRVPGLRNQRSVQLPLMPFAWKSLRRPAYDVVLSSTHAFGREFVRSGDGLHLNYVHAPMRYAWTPELDGRGAGRGAVGEAARRALRYLDRASVKHVDSFAANSRAVAGRIERFYGREARVIPPPVDVEYFSAAVPKKSGYLLAASRMIPYKRMDLAIEVAAKLDLPIVVAGRGPCESELRQLAAALHPNGVTFEIGPSRERLRQLMADAEAFVFPGHEDFGIIMAEALAAGTPVVGLNKGGAVDIVDPGVSGTLAEEQTVESFVLAVERCLDARPQVNVCRGAVRSFSYSAFSSRIGKWVLQTQLREMEAKRRSRPYDPSPNDGTK